jgi:hypothetical protein
MKHTTEFYKVYKVFRVSNRKQILRRNLTRDEATRVVNSYPDSSRSMVVFSKQKTQRNHDTRHRTNAGTTNRNRNKD